MALDRGARLGPYEILAPLGAGGMGEVYRARDTRLHRDVAVKVLPPAVARDPDRRLRFEREAHAVAALSHPNILALHDIGTHDDQLYVVTELLDGQSLDTRLSEGALPVRKAVEIAAAIGRGLTAAHGKGIAHRDLKPANVFLLADGQVKILDFGLARTTGDGGSGASATQAALTDPGTVLGTVGYMAPEQVRGADVDGRADLFALGVVLHEMLTGTPPFRRETSAETLTAILREDPPELTRTGTDVPPGLERIVRHCMEKNPAERFQTARDVVFALEALSGSGSAPARAGEEAAAPATAARRVAGGPVAASLAVLLVGALLGVAGTSWVLSRRSAPGTTAGAMGPSSAMLSTLELPSSSPLMPASLLGVESTSVALSPDGTHLAYVGRSGDSTLLYLRELSRPDVVAVAGSEGAIHPFFSPDSRSLGFLTNDKVKKAAVSGGAPVTLCDARVPLRAVWTREDTIYFSEDAGARLAHVPAAGGTSTTIPAPAGMASAFFSDMLPGGRTALFTLMSGSISADYADIVAMSLDTGETTVVMRGGYDGRYVAPGWLLFARAGDLWVTQFDAGRHTVAGEPRLVASAVRTGSGFAQMQLGVSEVGLLAFPPGGDRSVARLAWIDRQGRTEWVDAPARMYGVVDVSPDGRRLAAHVADVRDYVWVYDVARREGRRLAFPDHSGWPVWNAAGDRLAFTGWTNVLKGVRILTRGVDGSDASEEAFTMPYRAFATTWSSDGQVLGLTSFEPGNEAAVFVSAGRDTGRFSANGSVVFTPSISPDGRWAAYSSNETGQFEIWIRAFEDRAGASQISTDGGIEPQWLPSGALFYRSGNRWMVAQVTTEPALKWEPPRLAFETDFIDTPGRSYAVSPDGQRLLVVKGADPDRTTAIQVLSNWTAIRD
ncbi:MAG TPA: protein kinase [Vicinamibacterales bacterium]|nr:protein kinase [Vicinamibacterales bacterium]